MTLKNFKLKADNHFVAMEYYALILNRTFLVLLTKDNIIGLKCNGLVSIEGGGNIIVQGISKSLAIGGDLTNPYSYLKEKYLRKIEHENLSDRNAVLKNRTNFIIPRADIKNAFHDPKKKWGMGYYPHDGKVYVETIDKRKREFIILGNQSGQKIANLIMKK